ncbi:GNAT family N-acetyltransferase [Arenimonas terrae]|nr:GNAT family N-acetyltransferase [Arenimonas terrae]
MADWLSLSESESRRFGLRVARHPIDAPPPAPEAILAAMRTLAADIAVLRFDAADRATPAALASLGAMPVYADTLVYYARALDASLPAPTAAAATVRRALPSDRQALERIAVRGFQDYRSHYGASACFPAAQVEAGYVEWALTHLQSTDPRDQTWLVEAADGPAGFATLRTSADGRSVEILLNAVLPEHQGRGLYRTLVAQALLACGAAGVERASVSTQVWNTRVQQAWTALGFRLERAYSTYHLRGPQA